MMCRRYGGETIEAFGIVEPGNSSKELGEGFGMVLGIDSYTDPR
jgi:hypothetical protein